MKSSDPHSFADLDQGRIRHIDFDLVVDFESKRVRGTARYRLEPSDATSLFFDVRGVEIASITGPDGPCEWSIDEQDKIRGGRLHIRKSAGMGELTIAFASAPEASALGWLEPSHTAGGKHPFLLSQCQAIHARSIFPCQDTPEVRFTYNATVDVPVPLTAAMSAARLDVRTEGKRTRCRFEMPQALPSYLFALAVGNLAFRELGPRSGVYAEPEVLDAAADEFAETERMIEAAEKLFGPYLWDRFDMLVLPPAFPYGGMENPRLTFLTPTLIVGDRSMVNVVAHELAHSWTGNLVTNATWEDFWLNEGWTVLAERRILEVLEGSAFAQLQAALRREHMLEDMKSFGMDSDPTKLKFSQKGVDPDEVFSMVPYEKGASLLTLVEQTVGRETFDPFIIDYIQTHRFRSLSTEAFLDFLRDRLPAVAGAIDLHRWVYEAGFPDDAPIPTSPLLDEVRQAVEAFKRGELPSRERIGGWRPQQVEVFLKALTTVTEAECEALADRFDLEGTRNRSIQTAFFVVAIRSGYQKVLPNVEELIASVGRMLYLKPIYKALWETGWSHDRARPLFERFRTAYHPIAVAVIDRVLSAPTS